VPAVAALAFAVALERNRRFTSVQLLPGPLGDPFGARWDCWARPGHPSTPSPLGDAGLLTAQLLVLLAGTSPEWASWPAAWDPRDARPAAVAVTVTAAASALLVAAP
jgi:hypothetical protein